MDQAKGGRASHPGARDPDRSANAALLLQEPTPQGRTVSSRKAPQERIPPVVKTPDAAKPAGSSSPIIIALPAPEALHELLRQASSEALAVAKAKPVPSSRSLATIAATQAKAGDPGGAHATFADAVHEAEGAFGGTASAQNLCEIARTQTECGLKVEARTTLQSALKAIPDMTGDFSTDMQSIQTLSEVVHEQAGQAPARMHERQSKSSWRSPKSSSNRPKSGTHATWRPRGSHRHSQTSATSRPRSGDPTQSPTQVACWAKSLRRPPRALTGKTPAGSFAKPTIGLQNWKPATTITWAWATSRPPRLS